MSLFGTVDKSSGCQAFTARQAPPEIRNTHLALQLFGGPVQVLVHSVQLPFA